MNKSVKRGLVVILAVLLALVFAGCGIQKKDAGGGTSTDGGTSTGGGGTTTPTTAASSGPEGKYTAKIDMSEMVAAEVGEQTGAELSGTLYATLIMELNKDETYKIEIDLEQFFVDTEAYYREVMPQLIKALFEKEGISEDMIETAIKMQGYNSYDEFVDAMVAASMEAVREEYAEDEATTMSEGTYSISDGKISLYEEGGDGTMTDHGTVNDDGSITLYVDMNGKDTPLNFTKQ